MSPSTRLDTAEAQGSSAADLVNLSVGGASGYLYIFFKFLIPSIPKKQLKLQLLLGFEVHYRELGWRLAGFGCG